MKRYGATQIVIYLRLYQTTWISNSIIDYLLASSHFFGIMKAVCVHVNERGCYVNVETYTKVFSDKQD